MGMPSMSIKFRALARTMEKRNAGGIVALILEGNADLSPQTYVNSDNIEKNVSDDNKQQIEFAFEGGTNKAEKVRVYFCQEDYENLEAALEYFESEEFNYLAFGSDIGEENNKTVKKWLEEQRREGRAVKAVMANFPADAEYIINYTTESVSIGDNTFPTDRFCSRIAGLLAGTPPTESSTYAELSDVDDCTRLKKAQLDEKIDAGEFVLFYDGTVRVGRGVNSLTKITADQQEDYKKIKIIDIMDAISSDITSTVKANWIGKVSNTYSNKCLLISAIGEYLNGLILNGMLSDGIIEIDINANKEYLEKKGVDTSKMSEEDIKKANTDDKVFLAGTISMVDAMEDIRIEFTV